MSKFFSELMTRPLKFRAWHEEDKVMVYELNSPRLVDGELMAPDECYDFMKYTGLKDKKGLEIYEGDIIQYYDTENRLEEPEIDIGIVKFGEYKDDESYTTKFHLGWYIYWMTEESFQEEKYENTHSLIDFNKE